MKKAVQIAPPPEVAAEAVDPTQTVQEVPVVEEPVISRFVEVADQLRFTIGQSMDANHRPVALALVQEMQELYEAK